MVRLLLSAILCTFFLVNCTPTKQETSNEEVIVEPAEIAVVDTVKNEGLIEWATFFKQFSKDLGDFDLIKEQMHFPFISYDETILEREDLYLKDYEILLPESFVHTCEKANKEMSKELNQFETNKLFKFENFKQGLFKLLIEYTEEKVTITHFEHIQRTKRQFEHTTYTFEKIDGKYYLISITQ